MLTPVSNRYTQRYSIFVFTMLLLLITTALPANAAPTIVPPTAPEQPQLDNSEEIVYLDTEGRASDQGRLKVLDPLATGTGTIKWQSNETVFYNFALGDFNADGDMEIVAINRSGKQLVVYDPVVASGINDGQVDGIPWRKLVTRTINGFPNVIATGNFDPGVPGDEIAVGYEVEGGSPAYRVEILKATSATPDGASWVVHQSRDFTNVWGDSSVGDMIFGGANELLLRDFANGNATVFRLDSGFVQTNCVYSAKANPYNPPLDTAVGQWTAGGSEEVALTREFTLDGAVTFPRFYIFECVPKNGNYEFEERYNTKYNGVPNKIFTADVTGNNDDEFILLRSLAANDNRDRIFTENPAGDSIDFHSPLDSDSGFKSGYGGDVDGDGKDEIVIMRNNKIRIYKDPEIGATSVNPDHYQDYTLNTNEFSIEIGDLDKNGYQIGYSLVSNVSSLKVTVSAGDKVQNAGPFTIRLNNENISKQHNTPTVEGMPAGVFFIFRVNAIADPSPGFTPTEYVFDVDATNATTPRPDQPYQGFVVVTSNDPEVKDALRIPLSLTLSYARLEPNPSTVSFVYFNCAQGREAKTQDVVIAGTPGISFEVINSAVSASNADAFAPWLTVSPLSGKTGDKLQFTIDPTKLPSDEAESTSVLIQGDEKTGPTITEQLREIKVVAFCATTQLFMPVIAR